MYSSMARMVEGVQFRRLIIGIEEPDLSSSPEEEALIAGALLDAKEAADILGH